MQNGKCMCQQHANANLIAGCAGFSRAHGIAHQKVGTVDDLQEALQAAWGLNKHSIVEVITSRCLLCERPNNDQSFSSFWNQL